MHWHSPAPMGSPEHTSASLFQILYLSQLAQGVGFDVVKDIVRTSRSHNPARNITGALLFDGERFCQLLEGNRADVAGLMLRIQRDARHGTIRTLHAGPVAGRALRSWRSGYCESAEDLDAFEAARSLSGAQAVQAFVALARTADLE